MVAQQAGLLQLPDGELLLQDETEAAPSSLQAANCSHNETSSHSTTFSPANPSSLQASFHHSSKHNTSNFT